MHSFPAVQYTETRTRGPFTVTKLISTGLSSWQNVDTFCADCLHGVRLITLLKTMEKTNPGKIVVGLQKCKLKDLFNMEADRKLLVVEMELFWSMLKQIVYSTIQKVVFCVEEGWWARFEKSVGVWSCSIFTRKIQPPKQASHEGEARLLKLMQVHRNPIHYRSEGQEKARITKEDWCGKHKWRRRARVLVWRRMPWIERDGEWELTLERLLNIRVGYIWPPPLMGINPDQNWMMMMMMSIEDYVQ